MNELKEFIKNKYSNLEKFINGEDNKKGIIGVCAHNGEYNTYYEKQIRYTPDPRHFEWAIYIKSKAKLKLINIYTTKPNGKLYYLVLLGKEQEFLSKYPEGESINP